MTSIVRRKDGQSEPTLHVSASIPDIRYDGIFVRITVKNYEIIISPAELEQAQAEVEAAWRAKERIAG